MLKVKMCQPAIFIYKCNFFLPETIIFYENVISWLNKRRDEWITMEVRN
jgi:hypothetical protein